MYKRLPVEILFFKVRIEEKVATKKESMDPLETAEDKSTGLVRSWSTEALINGESNPLL